MREARPHLGQASPHPVLNAGWGFAALLLLGTPAVADGQATKAGTRIINQATVNYLDESGGKPDAPSNLAVIEVGRVAGVRLEPPRDTVASPGATITFRHRLTNLGNAPDSFTVVGHPPAGWGLGLFLDGNGDGRLDAGDQPITNPVGLAPGAGIDLLAVVTLPGGSASGGASDSVAVSAGSHFDPTVIARLIDRLQVRSAALVLSLAKVVDRATAVAGDLVTYRIRYLITGSGTAVNFRIVDPIPGGSSYHPGSLSHTGTNLTAGSGAESFDPGMNRIVVEIPTVTAGDSGTVRFQVRADSTGILTNVATGSFEPAGGRDSVASNPAITVVAERPRATLRKELVGNGRARTGDTVQYRLGYGNGSAQTAIVAASITDSLPAGLTFASSQPAPTFAGRVLRWDLGDLAPGQDGEILLRVVVSGQVEDSVIRNSAWFSASNAAAVGSIAAELAVVARGARSLELTKTADLLEVGLGETAPFTLVVRNSGTESLANLVVHDLLPADSRYAATTASGADSVTARGREVTFYLAGPVAPGASRTIRYAAAVVSTSTRVLENTAFATAEAGTVRSADAVAWVRVRAEAPMTTRVVIGKVWVDRNGDRVQQPGEPGVEGADIWTDDGEVSTTDRDGRFSFRNIRLGRHGFRLDPGSIPAEFALADPRVGADLLMLDVTGWTTPRVSFRLTPRRGPVSAVAGRDSAAEIRHSDTVEPVRVPELRQTADRSKERSRTFLQGPGVEFFSPFDGQVLRLDRVFVGVKGEPGRPVALFDGDSLLAEATLRPDGVHDFLAVPLAAGAHRLRIRMTNSWSADRWDSLTVHVSGRPASFKTPTGPALLGADGRTVVRCPVLVLDRWGVAVVNRPLITIEATGAEAANPDEDPSSVGIQVTPDSTGWLDLRLRPGRVVTRGRVRLSHADRAGEFPIEVVAAAQPLLVAAVGQVGVGASAEAMGAVTVRGRLDRRTSLVASYDSRHLDAGRDAFGRNADPLEEAQYPILGDASAQRTLNASRYRLAARIERGFDWLELGDVSTGGFGAELRLGGYRRALPGAAARVTTGPVVWQAFGSSTSQMLRQGQFRGAGTSGPYLLGGEVRPGTEQVAIEVRAEDNAARILSREVLVRYLDYQIDYQTGVLLLRRPVPAADPYGSPVFITVGYESDGGGPPSQVWGMRAAVDGRGLVAMRSLDSLRIGATWVRETPGAGDRTLVGTDLRFRRSQAFEFGAELSHARSRDSSGVAVAVDGAVTLLGGAAKLAAGWLSIGREFANPSNPALRGGTSEFRLAGDLTRSSRSLSLAHEWQRFTTQEAKRRRTAVTLRQAVGAAFRVEATGAAERYEGPSLDQNSVAGELTVRWQPKGPWSVWAEARHQFSGEGPSLRPDYVGAGAGYQLSRDISIEMRHRRALLSGGAADYSVTDLGVRGRLGLGTEGYGSYQLTGIEGARNAALIGLRNRLRLGDAWSLNTMVERRVGLDRAAVFDPVRALPFLQAEESYWSAGLGAEFLPSKAPYRVSARGEYRDGDFQRTRLATVVGDLAFNRSLALLTRQELLRTEHRESGAARKTHRYSSLWGVAFRPIASDALNLLVKFEWIDADQAAFGGLATGPAGRGRTVFAAEGIGQPARGLEFAARYAHRRASGGGSADGGGRASHSSADFIGWRGTARLIGPLELRIDARLLRERTSRTTRSDISPFIVLLPGHTVEVSTGYRMGDLRDPDFAVRGGRGWFLTVDARVTEQTLQSAADFWRARLRSNGGTR